MLKKNHEHYQLNTSVCSYFMRIILFKKILFFFVTSPYSYLAGLHLIHKYTFWMYASDKLVICAQPVSEY